MILYGPNNRFWRSLMVENKEFGHVPEDVMVGDGVELVDGEGFDRYKWLAFTSVFLMANSGDGESAICAGSALLGVVALGWALNKWRKFVVGGESARSLGGKILGGSGKGSSQYKRRNRPGDVARRHARRSHRKDKRK